MSELTLPKDIARPSIGLMATLHHARYVLRDNSVTGFAFVLFALIVLAALIASDFAPLQGFVLTMAVMYVALNLLIDILYGVIDPRMRVEA